MSGAAQRGGASAWRQAARKALGPAKRAATFVFTHWAWFAAAIVLVMVWSPPVYRYAIDRLPSAYYKVGSLGNPPRWTDMPGYNIDFAPIDAGNRGDRVAALIGARNEIARLGEDVYIPGRGDPRAGGIEAPGKTWEAPGCLLVDDVLFRAVHRWARFGLDADGKVKMVDGTPEYEFDTAPIDRPGGPVSSPVSVTAMTAAEIRARNWTAADYLAALNRALPAEKCLQPNSKALETALDRAVEQGDARARVPVCPRVEVWFYGSVAPCSIRPF